MREPTRSVLAELNSLSAAIPEEATEINRLNVLLGIGDEGANQEVLKNDPALLRRLADGAVFHGTTFRWPQEISAPAQKVRQALAAVEVGDDQRALELVGSIHRSSPLADWKLFVRSLIAFYAGDNDRRDANWSRLDSSRKPRLIAETLTVATGGGSPATAAANETHQVLAARRALESPLAAVLRQIQTALQDDANWVGPFRTLKQRHGESRPVVLERVAELLAEKFSSELDFEAIQQLQKQGQVVPLDPRFNRALALLNENDREADDVVRSWSAYISDLAGCKRLNSHQRRLTTALVYQRMADLLKTEAVNVNRFLNSFLADQLSDEIYDERADEYRTNADRFYGESRKHDPDLSESYSGHCEMLVEWGKLRRASTL